jgi:type I restriction enzyme, S subunit
MSKEKLPEGWKEVELGNQEYFTILSSGIDKFKGEKDYLSTESVQGTKIDKIECIITYEDRPSRANMQPVFNSVWFAKMQATLKVYSFDEENKNEINKYILSTGFAGIKVNEELVSSKYLRLIIASPDFNDIKDKMCTGSTQRGINNQSIEKISLIIPPIQTQKKIISVLENAEKARDMRKDADELAKDFLKSVFIEMFGDPVSNNKKWDSLPLGELCTIRRGASPRPIESFIGDEIPWIKIGDGTKGNELYIENTAVKITKKGAERSVFLKAGSLIFANCGVSLGFARILKIDGCIHDGWLSFEKLDKKLNQIYLLKLINQITLYLIKLAPEGTQPNLNTGIMKNLKIPLPPIELQNKFSSIVREVELMKEQQKKSKEQINNLFNVLMQKAFKGELKI